MEDLYDKWNYFYLLIFNDEWDIFMKARDDDIFPQRC